MIPAAPVRFAYWPRAADGAMDDKEAKNGKEYVCKNQPL